MSSKEYFGYLMQNQQWAPVNLVNLSYGAQVLDGTAVYSDPIELGDKGVLRLALAVTELGATHLDVTIWTRATPADSWRVAQGGISNTGLFTHVEAAPAAESLCFLVDRWVRAEFHNAAASTSTSTLTGEAV